MPVLQRSGVLSAALFIQQAAQCVVAIRLSGEDFSAEDFSADRSKQNEESVQDFAQVADATELTSDDEKCSNVEGGALRRSAWRRWSKKCKCPEGFGVDGDSEECIGHGKYYSPSLTAGICTCKTLSAACEPGVFLQVVKQPLLGLKHWAVPSSALTFASFTHRGGCTKYYALTCTLGLASIEITVDCPDTHSTVDAEKKLPGRRGPFQDQWEICTNRKGRVTLLHTIVDEVWDTAMDNGTDIGGCLRVVAPDQLPNLAGMRGTFAEQQLSLKSLKQSFGGCPQFTTDEQRIERGWDFSIDGIGWWMRDMQKGARLRARNFAGNGKWLDQTIRIPYSNLYSVAFIKFGMGENRTSSFDVFAHLNCGQPMPFFAGPMLFRYEQTSALMSDLTQERTYSFATVESTSKCFETTFLPFLSAGTPEHTQVRQLIDEAGWNALELPEGITFTKQPGKKVPSLQDVGSEVIPLLFRSLWGKVPEQATLKRVIPYLEAGPRCIFGKVSEQLFILSPGSIRKSRDAMYQFVAQSARAETMSNLLDEVRYVDAKSRHSHQKVEPSAAFLRNMADLTLFAGVVGGTDMALKCIKYQYRDPAHVRMYRENRTTYLHELMRYDAAVTSVTAATKIENTNLKLEGREVVFEKGTSQQFVIASANRDASEFSSPEEFIPGRPEEYKSLSWNGKLSAVIARDYNEAPRFCPGYGISMKITIAVCDHFTQNLVAEEID